MPPDDPPDDRPVTNNRKKPDFRKDHYPSLKVIAVFFTPAHCKALELRNEAIEENDRKRKEKLGQLAFPIPGGLCWSGS